MFGSVIMQCVYDITVNSLTISIPAGYNEQESKTVSAVLTDILPIVSKQLKYD